MNSAQVVGKIESRNDAGSAAGVPQSLDVTLEQPRILDLLLRIPVGNMDSQLSREATAECCRDRGRACPFRALCAE